MPAKRKPMPKSKPNEAQGGRAAHNIAPSEQDLADVIAASQIAMLRLDRELRVKWSTPALRSGFHVTPADAGRPVGDLGPPLTDAGLVANATAALEQGVASEHEQRTPDGHYYLRRIVPYRVAGETPAGVMVIFFDISSACHAVALALDAKQQQTAALEDQVRQRTTELRDLAFALASAEEQERRNLAQDLHDDLAQVLSIAKLKLAGIGKSGTDTSDTLQEVNTLLDQASRSVHSLAFQLSPSVLYELGLMPAIEWLAEEMQRIYGLHVTVNDDGAHGPLDERIRNTLYRAVRELLINVARHAQVNAAEVSGRRQGNRLLVEVRDGGAGFDTVAIAARPGRGGFGLISVRERIEMIGGSVTIDSMPGRGTVVMLAAPLLEEASAPAGAHA